METEKENTEKPVHTSSFESKKITRLNKFFMRNVFVGLGISILMFVLTVGLLLFTLFASDIDGNVKVTIVSMIATFVLTTSKTMIDRVIELVTYTVRLLGEEQRGLNKKLGVEIDEVEFGDLNEDTKEKQQ